MDPATATIMMTVGSTLMSFVGQQQQAAALEQEGADVQAAKNYERDQMRVKAGQERASAQRAAITERKQKNLVLSKLKTEGAASGGSSSDPSLVNAMAGILTEGQYREDVATYEGEDAAADLETGAALKQFEGDSARKAGKIAGKAKRMASYSTLAQGANSSLYAKYSPDLND